MYTETDFLIKLFTELLLRYTQSNCITSTVFIVGKFPRCALPFVHLFLTKNAKIVMRFQWVWLSVLCFVCFVCFFVFGLLFVFCFRLVFFFQCYHTLNVTNGP